MSDAIGDYYAVNAPGSRAKRFEHRSDAIDVSHCSYPAKSPAFPGRPVSINIEHERSRSRSS
jgi:hypothetical protein